MVPRRATRQQVTLFIGGELRDNGCPPVPFGRTRDLSLSGVYVVTDERPPVSEERQISLVWGDDAYSCRATVVRHGDDGIAFRFNEPGPGFMVALRDILGQQENVLR